MSDETAPVKKTETSVVVKATIQKKAEPAREKPVKKQTKTQKANRKSMDKLISRWPDLFCDPPKPLAIGVYDDLVAQMGPKEGHSWVKRAVFSWVNRWIYKKALAAGGARFNLAGESGAVSPEEQEHAIERLDEMHKQRETDKNKRKLEKKQT